MKKHLSSLALLIPVSLIALIGACDGTSTHTDQPPAPEDTVRIPDDSLETSLPDSLRLDGLWYTWTDNGEGGLSELAFTDSAAGPDSGPAVQIKAFLHKGSLPYDPAVGMGMRSDGDGTSYKGLRYRYKGCAHRIRVEIAEVSDYSYHGVSVPASRTWTEIHIPWSEFRQEAWGTHLTFSPAHINAFSWEIKGAEPFTDSLTVSDIGWSMHQADSVPADFVIRPGTDPAEVVVGNLSIGHPLQAIAEKSLDHGINLTNWLEDPIVFDGFEYNESTVAQLADFGFRGIRLPIDLDQYILNKSNWLAGSDNALHLDSTLFTPLDSFMIWTKRHGMSLTIDNHQYDGSLTMTNLRNSRYRTLVKALWASIAARYANDPRTDLFYELANEPDVQIDAETWHAFAQEIIDTIRTADATRPLLYGAVNWYRIPELVAQEPFADQNIIYVFHFYEPFLFTHQGAPWEKDLAGVHDIAFPYDSARWANNYAYFGAKATWVKQMINQYPDSGNRATMKNLIYRAKQWAVTHNVPVICNEFGANTFASTHADRLSWLATTVDILEELRIPWQHWGYDSGNDIVDRSGNLLPGISEAFRLR